jgi:hypothetical protein
VLGRGLAWGAAGALRVSSAPERHPSSAHIMKVNVAIGGLGRAAIREKMASLSPKSGGVPPCVAGGRLVLAAPPRSEVLA